MRVHGLSLRNGSVISRVNDLKFNIEGLLGRKIKDVGYRFKDSRVSVGIIGLRLTL